MKKLKQFIFYIFIGINLTFASFSLRNVYAESTLIQANIEDIFYLPIHKPDDKTYQTTINMPDSFHVQNSFFEAENILYIEDENLITITWEGINQTYYLPLLTSKSGNNELTIESNKSNNEIGIAKITVTILDADNKLIPEIEDENEAKYSEEDSILHKENQDTISSKNNGLQFTDTENNTYIIPETINENDDIKNNFVHEVIEFQDGLEVSPQQITSATVEVNNWDTFVLAMENPNITTIFVNSNLKINRNIELTSDKIIYGNHNTFNFQEYRVNMREYELTFNNAFLEVNQGNSDPNASVFYSDQATTLTTNTLSFNGEQKGQVARLTEGNIIVEGTNHFVTNGPFEIFEATNIVFEENSEFFADNTAENRRDNLLKEVINLYNDASITIKNGAKITLQIQDRPSIIKTVSENTRVDIQIQENAILNIIAKKHGTSNGEPLLNFRGNNSRISLGKNAVLNIENHREPPHLLNLLNDPGSLLSMHGVILFPYTSDMTINYYKSNTFMKSSIIGNEIRLSGEKIINTFSFSEDLLPLNNQNTDSMTKLLITGSSTLQVPIINPLNDTDRFMTGKAEPGITILVEDSFENIYEGIADPITGEFSIELGDYAPYKVDEVFNVKVRDNLGMESESAIVTVMGKRFSFRVPSTLNFQQRAIADEVMEIPRIDDEWSIEVIHTGDSPTPWRLTAIATGPLKSTGSSHAFDDALVFKKGDDIKSLTDEPFTYVGDFKTSNQTIITWPKDEGILLRLNPKEADVYTPYTTQIEWILTNAP